MKTIHCPYLGLPDDPGTALDFPSPGNFCQKANPPTAVRLDYQQSTCLTARHTGCPVYNAAVAGALPEPLRLAASPEPRLRRALWLVPLALLLLAGIIVLAVSARSGLLARARIPVSGQPVDGQAGFDSFSLTVTAPGPGTELPLTFASSLDAGTPAGTACPQPQNWVPYTVNPTDSLYRLAVIYGVPVETLQQQNCLGSETVLTPGQVIYVPFSPTDTPVPTYTATRIWPTWTPTTPSAVQAPGAVYTATPKPAAVTATTVPPTVVVPTATPIPPTAIPTVGTGGNKVSKTIDCGGKSVSVSGNNNNVTFTGVCAGLTVTGNKNKISIPSGTPVTDNGQNNQISFY